MVIIVIIINIIIIKVNLISFSHFSFKLRVPALCSDWLKFKRPNRFSGFFFSPRRRLHFGRAFAFCGQRSFQEHEKNAYKCFCKAATMIGVNNNGSTFYIALLHDVCIWQH
ncbi:hypothetical protein C0J52_16711 [Blattella germanica]|nr:hypothetical protein C0J52_16711 [Blattella germanica]